MKSRFFFETVFRVLHKMWLEQLLEVIDYMKTIRDDIPYFRIFVAVGQPDRLQIFSQLFIHILQHRIAYLYKNTPDSNWDLLSTYMRPGLHLLQISRKLLLFNMLLNPVVVEEHTKLNRHSLPILVPLRKSRTLNNSLPELVVYLGNAYVIEKYDIWVWLMQRW